MMSHDVPHADEPFLSAEESAGRLDLKISAKGQEWVRKSIKVREARFAVVASVTKPLHARAGQAL
jgi:hypothetical protein